MATSLGHYGVSLGPGQLEQAVASADVLLVDDGPCRPAAAGHTARHRRQGRRGHQDPRRVRARDPRPSGGRRPPRRPRCSRSVAASSRTLRRSSPTSTCVASPWSYVPTTLMAMVDSCIGGKSSINVGGVEEPRRGHLSAAAGRTSIRCFLGSLSLAAPCLRASRRPSRSRSAAATSRSRGYLERYAADSAAIRRS